MNNLNDERLTMSTSWLSWNNFSSLPDTSTNEIIYTRVMDDLYPVSLVLNNKTGIIGITHHNLKHLYKSGIVINSSRRQSNECKHYDELGNQPSSDTKKTIKAIRSKDVTTITYTSINKQFNIYGITVSVLDASFGRLRTIREVLSRPKG
tara:strand:- start:3409 stop:3858 length:450 start_codon:yes stop_codon:yes gene_type:complete